MEKEEQHKSSKVVNEISEERLNSLKGNYQKPQLMIIKENGDFDQNCSDMASTDLAALRLAIVRFTHGVG